MSHNLFFARLVAIAVLGFHCGAGSAEERKVTPATLEELRSAVAGVLEKRKVPAVGIAMVDRNGPVWIGALGKASLERDVDADESTLFRIGSTSKMFVALAVLKLVEEGRLSLDDRVAELVPELEFSNPWAESDPVRVVHLLEHTTGWDDIHLPDYAHNDPTPATLKEGLDFHPHSRVSRWVPGTRMSYCNAGPPVAAYIVQRITGRDFEDYVKANFFQPMGMETMTYRLSKDVREKGVTLYANGNQPQDYWHLSMRASGSINASPRDMAKFVAFFLNRGSADGRELISPESLKRMETTVSTSGAKAGQETGYGLNNYVHSYEQWAYREHNGGVNGGLSEFAYLPEAGLGHAILINSDDGVAFREISRLVRAYETRDLPASDVGKEREITAENRAIAGFYIPINPRQQVGAFLERVFGAERLGFEGDRLARKGLIGGDEQYYFPVSDTLYKSAKTGMIALSRATDPLAGPVVHAGSTVLQPVRGAVVWSKLGIAAVWGASIATSLLFFPVWAVRRWRGRIPPGAPVRMRVWPLLAALSALVFIGLFAFGMEDPFLRLGSPTPFSVGIMLATLVFPVFAVMGALASWQARRTPMNRLAYWHSAVSSLTHLMISAYLWGFGIIGLMTWA
jgi:CubicO group peptidase (beta-lactamase class C family)